MPTDTCITLALLVSGWPASRRIRGVRHFGDEERSRIQSSLRRNPLGHLAAERLLAGPQQVGILPRNPDPFCEVAGATDVSLGEQLMQGHALQCTACLNNVTKKFYANCRLNILTF
jgi:hypothetical protein